MSKVEKGGQIDSINGPTPAPLEILAEVIQRFYSNG